MQNDSPKYNVVIGKLCLYFKQDLNYKDNLHPLAEAAYEWMTRNILEKDLDNFYQRVIEHCTFFPKVTELSALYQNFIPPEKTIRIGVDDQLSIESLAGKISENEKVKSENKDIDIKELLEWNLKLSNGDMLKKYGYDNCCKLWNYIREQDIKQMCVLSDNEQRKIKSMDYIHD